MIVFSKNWLNIYTFHREYFENSDESNTFVGLDRESISIIVLQLQMEHNSVMK